MADKKDPKEDKKKDEKPPADLNTASKDSSEEAVSAAKEKMAAILKAQKEGREIEVDAGSLETTEEEIKPKKRQKVYTKSDYQVRKGYESIDHVKVYSPFRIYYDGEADSVSAENLTGPFDILGGHKNFMTLLVPGEIIIRSPRGEERIRMDHGVMQVSQNAVVVFLDV